MAEHIESYPLNLFSQLGLAEPIVAPLSAQGFTTPTPIQTQAIPSVIAGRDVLGVAATGTGKTAAFALPILHRLTSAPARGHSGCRALVLSPTRELAAQIAEAIRAFAARLPIRVALVIGGNSMHKQANELRRAPDIIVATPGRLLDHLRQGAVSLRHVETLVLDEADHMLDLGFMPSVRQLIRAMPAKRQNLFFSATMPKEIAALAHEMLRDPVRVEVTPQATTAERVDQSVVFVEGSRKAAFLASMLSGSGGRTLVFTRTKRGADKVVRQLEAAKLSAVAIHGNKSQGQRERALGAFKSAKTPILVATDIAARGIDVDGVELVVNFDLPHVPETYVHRIGRTARNGASGSAVSLVSGEERSLLTAIERTTRQRIVSRVATPAAEERAPEHAAVNGKLRRPQRPDRPAEGREPSRQEARKRKDRSGGSAIWSNQPRPGDRKRPSRRRPAGAQRHHSASA